MYSWASHRNWAFSDQDVIVQRDLFDPETTHYTFKTWAHPDLYKFIAISLIYPLVIGLYFSISRYLRLGSTIEFPLVYSLVSDPTIIALIFFSFDIFAWSLVFTINLGKIYSYVWDCTAALLHSIHIALLRKSPRVYFSLAEKLFKFSRLLFILLAQPHDMRHRTQAESTLFERSMRYVYFHPIIIHIVAISTVVLELLLSSGKLYYGLYTLFFYPIVRGVLAMLLRYKGSSFNLDVNLADLLEGRFENPHYPKSFWTDVGSPMIFFGFDVSIPEKYQHLALEYKTKRYYRSQDLPLRLLGIRCGPYDITIRKTKYSISGGLRPWCMRVAGQMREAGLRRFHLSSPLYAPRLHKGSLHPWIHQYLKNNGDPLDALILGALGHTPLGPINEKLGRLPSTYLFVKPPAGVYLNPVVKTPYDFVENTHVMSLGHWADRGVSLGTYSGMRGAGFPHPNETLQSRPDIVVSTKGSQLGYQGVFGLDHKNVYPDTAPSYSGRFQIIASDPDTFSQVFMRYTEGLKDRNVAIPEAIRDLKSSALLVGASDPKELLNNLKLHSINWLEQIHQFPFNNKPPRYFPPSYI